jgi:hypothetical protein
MIRDVIIIAKSGIPLFHKNFGACHSFGADLNMIAGFISALQLFSEELDGSDIRSMEMAQKLVVFHRFQDINYVVICDNSDAIHEIKSKIEKISEIFCHEYHQMIANFNGDISIFDHFAQTLIDLQITQKNCGGRPECEGCPNSTKTLPLSAMISEMHTKKSMWQRIKAKFRKN